MALGAKAPAHPVLAVHVGHLVVDGGTQCDDDGQGCIGGALDPALDGAVVDLQQPGCAAGSVFGNEFSNFGTAVQLPAVSDF